MIISLTIHLMPGLEMSTILFVASSLFVVASRLLVAILMISILVSILVLVVSWHLCVVDGLIIVEVFWALIASI